MRRVALCVTLVLASCRCGSPSSSADAGIQYGDGGFHVICLAGSAAPPHATLCVPDAGPPCCPPATCAAVPGGFACR